MSHDEVLSLHLNVSSKECRLYVISSLAWAIFDANTDYARSRSVDPTRGISNRL